MEHGLPVVCTVRVIYAFTAKEEGDLTINKGDIIKVHDNDGGWWKGTLLPDGIYGNFPSNFVEVISTNDDDSERSSPRSQPQSYRRQHSRQSSVDSSKFTKRKPVNTMLSNTNGTNKTGLTSSSASHLPYSGSTNASSISLGATSRKNPQAIIGDSGLCTTLPGAFPIASDTEKEPYLDSPGIQSDADYHLEYTSNQRRNSTSSALMDPSSPVHTTTYAAAESAVRQVSNRYSMPNLTDDTRTQQRHHPQHRSRDFTRPASAMYLQESDMGNKNSSSIWRGNSSGVSLAAYSDYGDFQNQELQDDQDYSEEQHHVESEILPTQQYDSFAGAPVQGHTNESLRYRPSYRHSGVSTGSAPFDYAPQQHQQQQQSIYSTNLSELSLENLAKHNRSQGALDKPKSQGTYGGGHRRNLSQVSLKPEGSAAFNPYDHQAQMYQAEHQSTFPVSARRSSLPRAPSIVIPQPKARPHSAYALSAPFQFSPTESSPSSYSAAQMHQLSRSPSSSATADSKGTAETLSSGGTAMSGASAIGTRDVRRKSETARMPQSNLMTASNFATRRFSVDAKDPLTSASVVGVSGTGESAAGDKAMDDASMSENLESLGAYTAKKPKASLMRAFKQILNPKKVAEKDAIRNKNEHFAWIEMQKSLKRVHSPEPGKEDTQFFADEDSAQENQDPFEIVKRCQPMRDSPPVPGGITSNNALELGPSTFTQIDKVARNVNQRGPHMTPQLLSQKYLTRPYSKSPLSKLRVLFIWVSENIKLEGGPGRDVSGGRYKLGPADEHMAALNTMANSNGIAASGSHVLRSGAMAPLPAVFMEGVDDYVRGFLQEDMPELAQDVLTSRTCKTGEGFANLFAEMALAAGIEDVGVVKGYIKGPMDVFSKDIPAANHAWNVIRIDGTYRFIDCCLASPTHPAHYPNKPQTASSFYFLTSPTELVLTHFPMFLSYQYISPSIPPQVFLQLPFVRPAFFEFGLSLPDFKRRTRLEIKDDETVEVFIRIDGGGPSSSTALSTGGGHVARLFGGDCLGKGCGEGIELRAEVEAMNSEGKLIRKRALAQIVIWNPYQHRSSHKSTQPQKQQLPRSQIPVPQAGSAPSTISAASGARLAASIAAASNKLYQPHHCTGIRIAKIKAVLPPETVECPGGVRKGVIHIFAGRKVDHAPSNATPYALALTLPIHHIGTIPKTPLNFVVPHFSPYEFYVKSPQTEFLYSPHTYKFCILSLAAQAQASVASANAMALTETEASLGSCTGSTNGSNLPIAATGGATAASSKTAGGSVGSSAVAPVNNKPQRQPTFRARSSPNAQSLGLSGSRNMTPSSKASTGTTTTASHTVNSGSLRGSKNYASVLNAINNPTAGTLIPRPERLVLRTQTNKVYKLVYNPVRHCHEAQIDIKERGVWECVRMDDGGKNRVGREGSGGVVIASWKCV